MKSTASLIVIFAIFQVTATTRGNAGEPTRIYSKSNLVAWCIVPFDAKKRGPAERAAMLRELGISKCAYDWRNEHVPTFEEEILQYKKHGIEFFAFWSVHEQAFKLFEKYDLHPQIWRTLGSPAKGTQDEMVAAAARSTEGLAIRTGKMGCKLGLYNHGGWGGEPKNLVAVCKRLRSLGHGHVGIVYNFHHGHGHIEDWAESLRLMQPYLLCLNVNGMIAKGQPKIVPISHGQHELAMLKAVVRSGYTGPIGVLDHRGEADARESLLENLEGLEWIRKELTEPGSGGERPKRRVGSKRKESAARAGVPRFDAKLVGEISSAARRDGNAERGAAVFAAAKSACRSCHKVGQHGGSVGPDLTAIGKDRDAKQIIESVLWPNRDVKPEYAAWSILTVDGKRFRGYRVKSNDKSVVLKDAASGETVEIARNDIEQESMVGTLMPDNLTSAMSRQEKLDVFRFLTALGKDKSLSMKVVEMILAHAHAHRPVEFPFDRAPLQPQRWPNWKHHVNRDRVYDFYTKEAEYFRKQSHVPPLLPAFPGLDGGKDGHWGNQNETTWASGRWNKTKLSSVQSGVFRGAGVTVTRGVCVRLGERSELSACFNPDTLTYDAVWSGGFVKFSSVRHGFLHGLLMDGKPRPTPDGRKPSQPFEYHGFYRHGKRVLFSYRIGETDYLDAPWVENGKFTRVVAPAERHPLKDLIAGGPPQWPQRLQTRILLGSGRPYAIDTIELPRDNPWNALFYCGGHDFLADGTALVCTMQGDVWTVKGLTSGKTAQWRRFASGLHQAQGLVVADDAVYVLGRDQITRLHDLNNDGEADFYQCVSKAFHTSAAGHDFICGLERDDKGNFYTASGSQGLLRISSDGKRADVIATGFRNPDGLGLLADGTITVPCSEGAWTPASMICATPSLLTATKQPPHFGYRGPQRGRPPSLPLAYLPRGLDNSSGGQIQVPDNRWGPLKGQLIHFSFGAGSHFLVLRDEVGGQVQGAVVPLPGDFLSGVHRGRFHPIDGQLYATGMTGWGSYTPHEGCFQRVRYTGDPVQLPSGFHVHQNGVVVTFTRPIDGTIAENPSSHFAQCWNYRYSSAYGSGEFSTRHPGVLGHDTLLIKSAHVLSDGRTLFLELPDLQPVSQLHLRLNIDAGDGHDLFVTVHELDKPFTRFSGYKSIAKKIDPHPILTDLALATRQVPNPLRKPIQGARAITIKTGKNLTFGTRTLRVRAGEAIKFTLANPDVVPHNWALVKPNALQRVGEMANRLIADPEAAARHYIPQSDDVLAYTDVVLPQQEFTIYFHAPKKPGRYPYLCTFPGHWMVMNGEMIVE